MTHASSENTDPHEPPGNEDGPHPQKPSPMNRAELATIFDIQRFSIHDGPGIRTAVFFKGCSLRCRWCHNPESISPRPELAFYAHRCLEGGQCAHACTVDAIRMDLPERVLREDCTACGDCATVCPSEALKLIGKRHTVDDLLHECLADAVFFETSGGGITLSGGEPVLQAPFLGLFLPRLRAQGIHVLLETAGHYPWRLLEPLLPHLDHIYYDWKVSEPALYKAHTGHTSKHIEHNLAQLVSRAIPLTVRVPLIPGLTGDVVQAPILGRTLRRLGMARVILLPYNRLWEAKLLRLDTCQEPLGLSQEVVDEPGIIAALAREGVTAALD